MSEYRCLVVSAEGRSSWRTVDAASEKAAIARLVGDGLTPIEIKSGAMGLVERLNRPVRFGRTLGIGEQSLVLTQLATLIRAGLPIDRCLDLLRDQSPRPAQRELLALALAGIRSGQSLAFALEQRDAFPGYVIGVIRSAERAGRLGDALTALAERLTVSAATRRQLITALTYPAAVLVATLIALALVLLLVVPQFEPIFAGQEERLPTLTRGVLALSALVTDYGVVLLVAALVVPLGLLAFLRSETGGALLQRGRRHIPGLMLRDQYLAAQFTGIFATLVGNGVTVIRALPLARSAIGSERWRRHLVEVERRVREGSTLSRALASGTFVPTTAVRLIEVGERSGQLADTCEKASSIMGEGARARIDRIVSLANPIAIVTLGGIVAMLVAGVMLGIFALGDFAG
jgi:type II secretory pathway component PulF